MTIPRGSTADSAGNVTMEREALTLDNLALATAADNSGGVVIVKVDARQSSPGLGSSEGCQRATRTANA